MREPELPSGWCEDDLGGLGACFRGRGGTRADEQAGGLPCIRYGDLYTHHDSIVRSFCSAIAPARAAAYTALQFGDLVFAGSGETPEDIGKAAAYCDSGPAYAGGDTIVFRPNPKLDSRFAGYAVNSVAANRYKSKMGQGSSVFHISSAHVSRLRLRHPVAIGEQQRIADILQTLDEAIFRAQALIAKTRQLKAGLMHDLFTRGVLPDGRLRPAPDEAPDLYTNSATGWIPKKWGCEPVESLLAGTSCPMRSGPFGSALLKSELAETGVPFLGIDNVFEERFVADFHRHVTRAKYSELRRYAVFPDDVMITIMGTVGRCCMFPEGIGDALSSKHIWTMTFDQSKVLPELVCWQLNHARWVRSWFSRHAQGAIMSAMQAPTLRSLRLPVPPMDEQLLIRARYRESNARIVSESMHLAKLCRLKLGLMHDLLTGRVRVPLAEERRAAS